MMRKQNKGSIFLPMQTRKNSELSIILTSLIFHCELAMINICPPRSSTGKWVVLRRELGRNAVDEKSVAVGIGVGYQEDPRWAKKSTPPVRGDFEKPPELYCTILLLFLHLVSSSSTTQHQPIITLWHIDRFSLIQPVNTHFFPRTIIH